MRREEFPIVHKHVQPRGSEREQTFNELEQQYYRGFEDGRKSTIRCLYGIKECRPEDLNTVIDELMYLIEGRKNTNEHHVR